jgi:predicted ATP-dependent endonuclease of OLD family
VKEKLIIKDFGPIKNVELELGRFNVLIGENATGKSTVAKILAVCRYFSYIKWDGSFEIPNLNESNFSLGLSAWGLNEYIREESFILYECQHYSLTVENKMINFPDFDNETGDVSERLEPIFSETLNPISREFKNLLSELESITPDGSVQLFWTTPVSFFQNNVAKVMDNPFYLPTERGLQSIFSLGKNSIQNISDSLFNQFARIDQVARLFKNDTVIEPLDISYKNVDGKGFVKKNNEEKFYSLFNAASGYQSTIPVVLLIKYYGEIRKKRKTFFIEEPELNLFPEAQKELVNYLVENSVSYGHTILLTTHSPYILTSLNNLMYAYEVGVDKPDEVNKVINKKYWINPEDVSAYRLLADGTAKKIITTSEDGTLIDADEIDEVSRDINKDFDELIRVDMLNEEQK